MLCVVFLVYFLYFYLFAEGNLRATKRRVGDESDGAALNFNLCFRIKMRFVFIFVGYLCLLLSSRPDLLSLIKRDPCAEGGAGCHAPDFDCDSESESESDVACCRCCFTIVCFLGCLLNTFRYTLAAKSPPFRTHSLPQHTPNQHTHTHMHSRPGHTHPLSCFGFGKRFKALHFTRFPCPGPRRVLRCPNWKGF